jgi:hypothetical protein
MIETESANVIKVRCPHCRGKIGLGMNYYRELEGLCINCPHCDGQMIIPGPPDDASPDASLECPECSEASPYADFREGPDGSGFCPRCGVRIQFED